VSPPGSALQCVGLFFSSLGYTSLAMTLFIFSFVSVIIRLDTFTVEKHDGTYFG